MHYLENVNQILREGCVDNELDRGCDDIIDVDREHGDVVVDDIGLLVRANMKTHKTVTEAINTIQRTTLFVLNRGRRL